MSVPKTPVTPDPPGIQLGKQVLSEATGQPGQVMLACSKSPSTSGMRPLMVFTLAAAVGAAPAGAPAGASKETTTSGSSANCHPVSVSIRSESSSGSALLTLNPHMTAHTSTTQAVIFKLAGDHRIRTMPPRLRLKFQVSNQTVKIRTISIWRLCTREKKFNGCRGYMPAWR